MVGLLQMGLVGLPGFAEAGPSEHARHADWADRGQLQIPDGPRRAPPPGDRRPDVRVYGYLAYWADDLDSLRWDALTDLALFAATATPDGRLVQTSRWGDVSAALRRAEPYGIRVHLTVINFDTSELRTLLGSKAARDALIAGLRAEVERTGAHGVNVDFEGVPADRRAELVAFTKDLDAVVPDVVLATPAVDWSDAWDYAALSQQADLFIMGYGYHWSGSQQAGPVDPLFGGSPWARWSLDWTLQDYRAKGAEMDRVILGLPLYGYAWRTGSDRVPADALASGEVVFYDDFASLASRHGRRLQASSATPWTWDGTRQAWASDAESVRVRVRHSVEQGAGGVGFWALNYEAGDNQLWEAVLDETDLRATTDDTGVPDDTDAPSDTDDTDPPAPSVYVANAGTPFFAYPGDVVELSAEWSTGPEPRVFRWVQVAGPPVLLDDPTAMKTRFKAETPGVHRFEVVVGDGTTMSTPAVSSVIVVERRLASGCGCQSAASGPWGFVTAFVALLGARRRRMR
jgi:MYXO-CTERM domain-containing protein